MSGGRRRCVARSRVGNLRRTLRRGILACRHVAEPYGVRFAAGQGRPVRLQLGECRDTFARQALAYDAPAGACARL